ncbi:amidohydrolase family protein [Nocardia crassostreae]|uniref:amidohydrolase family protein n=1 Tax=Nocardia crassostreae TaxID=53428 RepID=UPI0008300311|nr:amidohydrolase family protein [Nocardia crassostreae]
MIIDVHTHMMSEKWLDLLVAKSGTYSLGDFPGDNRAIYKASTAFVVLTPQMFDYDARIADMDAAGVDLALVSLTCPSAYWGGEEVSTQAARLINDDMAAQHRARPDRIGFLATLPWQYPARAVEELERACALGAAGVMVLANIEGVSLTDKLFAPIWQVIDERELPVLVHPTTPPGVADMDIDRFNLVFSVGFPFDTTLAVARMIYDGFLDRYSKLTIIGSHAGGTLPYLMGRLDAASRYYKAARLVTSELPSTYARRVYADAIAYGPEQLRLAAEVFGTDHLLFGSDYPHLSGSMKGNLDLIDTLRPAEGVAIKGENAARLFRLAPALPAAAS